MAAAGVGYEDGVIDGVSVDAGSCGMTRRPVESGDGVPCPGPANGINIVEHGTR
jgi:hypothetical protein